MGVSDQRHGRLTHIRLVELQLLGHKCTRWLLDECRLREPNAHVRIHSRTAAVTTATVAVAAATLAFAAIAVAAAAVAAAALAAAALAATAVTAAPFAAATLSADRRVRLSANRNGFQSQLHAESVCLRVRSLVRLAPWSWRAGMRYDGSTCFQVNGPITGQSPLDNWEA